jgi:hypothetical protein
MTRLAARLLPDGRRLHLNDGPIDLIIEAWGDAGTIAAAYRAATARAATILDELWSCRYCAAARYRTTRRRRASWLAAWQGAVAP